MKPVPSRDFGHGMQVMLPELVEPEPSLQGNACEFCHLWHEDGTFPRPTSIRRQRSLVFSERLSRDCSSTPKCKRYQRGEYSSHYLKSFALLTIRFNSIKFHFSSQNQTNHVHPNRLSILFDLAVLSFVRKSRKKCQIAFRIKQQISLLVESMNDPLEIHARLQLEAKRHPFVRKLIHGHLSCLDKGGSSKLVGVVFSV